MAGIALGFGGLNTLSIMGSGIKFPADGIFRGIISRPRLPGEPAALELPLFDIHSRSITTDIQPVLIWCNQEYTEIKNIELESNNSDEVVLTVNAAYELCNQFRDSLKPVFKLLGTRINEISEDVENIDVSEQLSSLENKFDNKLKEYVNKDELFRDDFIDIFVKVDNENHVLTMEFEGDTLYDGLLVFKIYAGAMISNMLRRLYIKITDGQIVDYKGVQDSLITIDGVTIEPAAKSEDYRIEYIPTAELDTESRKKFIKIPIIDPTVKIVGAVIEQSTFKRQMVYTTNDIAYRQDIEALDKKINTLAEQSHVNDVVIYNTYTTVDEVNEVLRNYVLKSDLPPAADLNEYYTKTESDEKYALKSDIKKSSINIINSNLQTIDIPYRDDESYYFLDGISNELKEAVKKYGIDVVGEAKNINTGERNINISGHYDFNYETSGGYNFKSNSFELHFNPDKSNELIKLGTPYSLTKLTSFTTKGIISEFSENDVPSINYADTRYVKTSGDSTINGNLVVNSSKNVGAFNFTTTANYENFRVMNLLAPNLTTSNVVGLTIGKVRNTNESHLQAIL